MSMSTLLQALRAEQKKKEEAKYKLIAYCLAPFITGWCLVWYNYIWVQWPVNYWQWTAISVGILLSPKWMKTPVMGSLSAVALIAQIAKWVGLLTLPLIKHL